MIKSEACQPFYCFFATSLINSIIHKHKCLTLYIYHIHEVKIIMQSCFCVKMSRFYHIYIILLWESFYNFRLDYTICIYMFKATHPHQLKRELYYHMLWVHNFFKFLYHFFFKNSIDPDQLASLEASWSGATLFSWTWWIHINTYHTTGLTGKFEIHKL